MKKKIFAKWAIDGFQDSTVIETILLYLDSKQIMTFEWYVDETVVIFGELISYEKNKNKKKEFYIFTVVFWRAHSSFRQTKETVKHYFTTFLRFCLLSVYASVCYGLVSPKHRAGGNILGAVTMQTDIPSYTLQCGRLSPFV